MDTHAHQHEFMDGHRGINERVGKQIHWQKQKSFQVTDPLAGTIHEKSLLLRIFEHRWSTKNRTMN